MLERSVWAQIDLAALEHNVRVVKGLLKPETKFCAVVKADAYGHGAIEVAKVAVRAGADYLAVAILSEALELRTAGFTVPILVLGHTPDLQARQVVAHAVEQTIFSLEAARALSEAAVELGTIAKVHIKVDTGMSRVGVPPAAVADFAATVAQMPGICIEGVFSHFATSDSTDKSYALKQLDCFEQVIQELKCRGLDIPLKHIANSAAILELPQTQFDMVRAGIILYGLWPSNEVKKTIELRPVMAFKSVVILVKEVPAGVGVSYGCIYVTQRPSRIATLPVGYADGWTRLLAGKASILIRGQRAPVIGRICMDQCMIDVTDIPDVQEGDEALLFGGNELPADEIADHLGTINYEVVCMVGKRVPRVYK
jgi:alanine racemase